MKLHLCCGNVYLEGYYNVDIQGIIEPSKADKTTFDNYYKYPLDYKPKEKRGNFFVDGDYDILEHWIWEENSIEEIVMIQAVEHFLPSEVDFIISEVYVTLQPGGKFIFDFPDIVKTVKEYGDKDFYTMNRLIYCNHKDIYSIHKCAYNEDTFTSLLETHGKWSSIEYKEVVKHDYPAIGGIAIK